MNKNKKKVIIVTIFLVILLTCFAFSYYLLKQNNKNSLTFNENKWIESNKQNVIDIAVLNNIPILSYDGEGIIYDFLDYVTEKQSLKFNIIPYRLDSDLTYDYKVNMVTNPEENDIVLLEDNLVLITKNNKEYIDRKSVSGLNIGIISSDKELLDEYFDNLNFVEYNTYEELKQSILNEEELSVDGIIIPKMIYTKELIENNYKVSLYMNDLKKYFVLSANGDENLNSIIRKYFNTWKESNLKESYNSNLLSNYYKFANITDMDQKKLQSKSYVYGFIDYGIYNKLNNGKISGFNELILKDFNDFSGLSITYTKYNSISKLLKSFNSLDVDFILNITDNEDYEQETYSTVGVFDKQFAIVSGKDNKDIIEDLYSLKDKEVLTIKGSYIEEYLSLNGIKVISYNNLKDLTTDFSNDDILVIDLENYNFYKSSSFSDTKINYIIKLDDKYNYIINATDENDNFIKLFNFYLNYNSSNKLISTNYDKIAYENINIIYLLVLIIVVLCIYVVLDFSNHVKYMVKSINKNKKNHLTKEEKIKYIDQLTSLKNRAYLNSKIEAWDDSEVYPQSIIIIDLNNISYINDNYGREEGDKVITEAANILIQHQLHNSEIIRTDGNEFLIYLVGYNEKQIVSYLRRLNKELKSLSHGFGAASGYSIINDAIKTVDDAVNEATLDMKNNKEDYNH